MIRIRLNKIVDYGVLMNGLALLDERSRLLKVRGSELLKFTDYQLDNRTQLVSIFNKYDSTEYTNYYAYMIKAMNNKLVNSTENNEMINLLDEGYIPYVIPPTFMNEKNTPDLKFFRDRANEFCYKGEKLNMVRTKPVTFNNTVASNEPTDIWVSRLQMAKWLKCKPEDVTMTRVFNVIIQGGV